MLLFVVYNKVEDYNTLYYRVRVTYSHVICIVSV